MGLEREPDTWINVDRIGHTTKHMDGGLERQPIHTGVHRIGERTKLKLTTRIRQTTNPSKAITPTYIYVDHRGRGKTKIRLKILNLIQF